MKTVYRQKRVPVTVPTPSCVRIPPSVGPTHRVISPSHGRVYAADLHGAFQPAYVTINYTAATGHDDIYTANVTNTARYIIKQLQRIMP